MAILEEADIVCSTLSFSGSGLFERMSRPFDVVVIDEAAQAVEPSTLVPMVLGCQQVPACTHDPADHSQLFCLSAQDRMLCNLLFELDCSLQRPKVRGAGFKGEVADNCTLQGLCRSSNLCKDVCVSSLILQVFLVGDPVQLPATVISDRADKHGYSTSLFKRLQTSGFPVQVFFSSRAWPLFEFRVHATCCS